MVNRLYDKGREKFLRGELSWNSNNIKAVLVDLDDYTADFANHDSLDDIPSSARVSISGNFTGKTTLAGVADADDIVFGAVSGDQSEAIVIFADSGTESTSALIAFIDNATGLPATPNGGDIEVRWNNGPDKIFRL